MSAQNNASLNGGDIETVALLRNVSSFRTVNCVM